MPINILVTEDENIVRKDIERCLGNLGYNVVASADNGEDAINMAKHKPDLALMDIMIKGDMNGIAAAEEIKRNMDIPLVFLTAYAGKHAERSQNGRAPRLHLEAVQGRGYPDRHRNGAAQARQGTRGSPETGF